MDRIWVGIDPRSSEARILAMEGPDTPLLKARLRRLPASRSALGTLLEGLSLWQGHPVRAALVADALDGSCRERFDVDPFGTLGSPLVELEYVTALRRPRRDVLSGMGPFGDLRQLLLFEALR